MKTTKILTILLFAMAFNLTAQEQEQPKEAKPTTAEATKPVTKEAIYKIEGNKIVKIKKTKKQKAQPVKTKFIYTLNGKDYQVFEGSKGGLFIIRTSKKGNQYKQYLKL